MSDRAVELAVKKVHLQYKCANERQQLGEKVAMVLPVFAMVDGIRSGTHWLREHPMLVGAMVAVAAVARPRAALRWIRRGLVVWRAWRKLRSLGERVVRLRA